MNLAGCRLPMDEITGQSHFPTVTGFKAEAKCQSIDRVDCLDVLYNNSNTENDGASKSEHPQFRGRPFATSNNSP